jgi:integrase
MGRKRGGKPRLEYGKWRIRWQDYAGQRHSEVFDTELDAINELRRRELEAEDVRRGLRPAVRAPDKTCGDAFDYFLKHRSPQKRSEYDDKNIVKVHLRPALGHVLLRDLNIAHIDRFVAERRHLNTKTISNLLTLLITMLNVAKDELRWIPELPRIRKPKSRDTHDTFRYFQTDAEIGRFLRAASDVGEHVHAFYATAVYTGMRAGELAGLRWTDIDFNRRLIIVQRSFDGPTKSGSVRWVPILDTALAVLRKWRLQCPSEFVFPNQRNKMHVASARIFKQVFRRTLHNAGFEERIVIRKYKHRKTGQLAEARSSRPHIRFHDLRHTFASHWVMKGGDIFKLQKILGHSTVQMTMRYAHLAPHAFVEDYGRFNGHAGSTGDVANLNEYRGA